MSPLLIITRGLPGCGKTTEAKAWVAADPTHRARVNRDDLRTMLHGGRLGTADQEKQVTVVQHAAIRELLARGLSVVCDDTNLAQRYARDLAGIAWRGRTNFDVWDLTDVPIEVCIERDAQRTGPAHVGEPVIRDMHRRYLAGRAYPLPWPEVGGGSTVAAWYTPPADAPTAVMVDIDGTVATMCGRSPYDETRIHEDLPNLPVIDAVRTAAAAGHRIVFCSGRTEACRDGTLKWLVDHVAVPVEALHMRAVGDMRKDAVVKLELFDAYIRHRYQVVYVLDDRRQVVQAWRSIGLTVLQVAEGSF